MGAERFAATVAINLAEMEFQNGDREAAVRLSSEALAAFRASNDTRSIAQALCNLSAYLVAVDRHDEARTNAREALAAARDALFSVVAAVALQHLVAVGALRPDGEAPENRARLARLLGYVDARLAALEALREYTEQHEYDKVLRLLLDAFGADECAKLMTEGSTWSEDQAVAEAMLI